MIQDTYSYAAGFLDGEGCFYSSDQGKICISCSNTDPEPIHWLHENFGGSLHISKARKRNHRDCYTWQVVSRDAQNVCSKLAPYLKQKSRQALLLIAIQQLAGQPLNGRHVSEEVRAERLRLSKLLKDYKREKT